MNAEIEKLLIASARRAGPRVAGWFAGIIGSVPDRQGLWQVAQPEKLVVVASTSVEVYTGEYWRKCTGIGQLGAFACAVDSLSKAYDNLCYEHVYLSKQISGQVSGKLLKNDLLLLGSPKTNHISKRFLRGIRNSQVARQEKDTILWKDNVTTPWTGAEKFRGRTSRRRVISDYGLIIRTRSPFQADRTVILFSGSHTYGTMAAALYFVTEMLTDKEYLESRKQKKNNIAALVKADVEGGFPVNICRLDGKFYAW